jgi:hypothetical protein
MKGGYSTLPGHPTSTTMPFKLEPSYFSGKGFTEGKYILRCSGLNAHHEPVVFADRDFNVLPSDLTTGTALPTTHGDLKFTKYKATDAHPPATPGYSVDVELQFLPKTAVTCSDISFIQSVQSVDSAGKSQHYATSAELDARQTPLAWSIDRVPGAPSPFYIMGRDSTGKVVDVAGWGKKGKGGITPEAATLIDRPSWNKADNEKFESCVLCRSGTNIGQVFGCATWGFTADSAGKVTLMPRSFQPTPSDEFKEARASWNTWRTSVAAATRPAEVPSLKKP